MVAILDYDAGNIKSVEKALQFLGVEAVVTRDPEVILKADHVILPGVGCFGDAMDKLHQYGLVETIHKVVEKQIPFLGICLGLQLIFEESEESPGVPGLGLCKGKIVRFSDDLGLKIPHIGWNSLDFPAQGALFHGMEPSSYVYFVHSYYLKAEDRSIVKATASYGVDFDASIEQGKVYACQFHPEKSSGVGMQILRNFLAIS